jgi:hypothetical protein
MNPRLLAQSGVFLLMLGAARMRKMCACHGFVKLFLVPDIFAFFY